MFKAYLIPEEMTVTGVSIDNDGWLTWRYVCGDGSVDSGVSRPDSWYQV